MNLQTIIIIGVLVLVRVVFWLKKKENKTRELQTELELSSVDFKQKFDSLKISGGTLRFWGNWFGKPMDNYHEIKMVEYDNETEKLTLTLSEGEKIRIWSPSAVKIGKKELRIEEADKIFFEWHYYGKNKTDENLRFESYINNGVKIKYETDFRNKKIKADCKLSEPALRIIGY
jgi:hypothetical protein